VRPLYCLLHIRVVEDEQWRLASSLKRDILEPYRSHFHDLSSRCGRSRECNLVDQRVLDQRRASLTAIAIHDVDNAGRKTSFLDECRKDKDRQRCLFRRLQYNGVTAGQSRAELPTSHRERVVPGYDLRDNADRLPLGVGKLLWCCIYCLAVDLVCPSSVVADSVEGLRKVVVVCYAVRLACMHQFGLVCPWAHTYHCPMRLS
jgi:hypothetical protein